MTENQYAIVEDDAPNRCQGVGSRGQCRFAAVPGDGIRYCPMHGGMAAKSFLAKQDQRRYRLAKWQDRVNAFADDDQLKCLNDEIGILRMTLENVLLACKEEADMLLYAPKIADLVSKIEKLVTTCAKLELTAGSVITKKAVFTLAAGIVDVVSRHVTDADAVARIADEIGAAVANIKSEDGEL